MANAFSDNTIEIEMNSRAKAVGTGETNGGGNRCAWSLAFGFMFSWAIFLLQALIKDR